MSSRTTQQPSGPFVPGAARMNGATSLMVGLIDLRKDCRQEV
jgi:hypothetical protein